MSESAKPHPPSSQAKGEKSHAGEFGYVGIDAILEQMRRKAMKQGFELNIMVVGKLGMQSFKQKHKSNQRQIFQPRMFVKLKVKKSW